MENSFKPIIVDDLSVWDLFKEKNETIYCIGSMSLDRYIKVKNNKDFIYKFSKNLIGKYSIKELDDIYKKNGIKFDVKKIIDILCRAGLIINCDDSCLEKQEMDRLSYKLFQMNLENKYNFFSKLSNLIFPYIYYLTIAIIMIGIFCFIINYKVFLDSNMYEINNSYEFGIIIMAIICITSVVIHELSHAFVACKYGLKPKKMIISLYLLVSPIIYLKIPGIYTLKSKKRIAIWGAGMYSNILIASISMIIFCFSNYYLKQIFYLIAITNLLNVATCLSPFIPTDGYFIMTTLLKCPNMRKNILSGKLKFFNSNNIMKSIYMFLTLAIITFIFGSQIVWITKEIINSYKESSNIFQFIFKIKIFAIILLIMIIKSILKNSKKRNLIK